MIQHTQTFLTASIALVAATVLTGCGGADTTINEREPIVEIEDDEVAGEDTSSGRLLVINQEAVTADIFDLTDNDLLATVALDALPSAVYATGDYRFAALIERDADKVGFIDGGLWQEPHDDHFDTFSAIPSLLNSNLTGSRPTHFVRHDGKVAVFLDGDAGTGANAGIQVFDDEMIEAGDAPDMVEFTMPMHGVAEPRGDHLISTIRRDDSLSTSANVILPDQVGVYHFHNDEYELEQTVEVICPDLHGAAQNEDHVMFGCSDGVLLLTDNQDGTYDAEKIVNSDDVLDGLRIGSVWGHHDSEQFIAMSSARGSDDLQFFAIDPEEGEMELIDWQPVDGASPVVRGFSFEAEQFLILDSQGMLTLIEPHDENGHTHWEFGERLDITDADVATMPDGNNFSMTFAQNGHFVHIADPIEQHVITVNLALLEIVSDIELDYVPSAPTWLGIAGD